MKKHLLRKFTVFLCLFLPILLLTQPILACSWDYPIWQNRNKNADPLYRFIKNGKAGYIDQKGKTVVEPKLEHFSSNSGDEFSDGLLLTSVADGPYIDKTGKIVLNTGYNRNWYFSDGLAAAMKENNGKWGYIDKTGKFVISPRFESYPNGYVYPFANGLAMIEVKDKYGYIDRTGEFVIEPQFLEGNAFSEGLARVVIEGPCVFIPDGPCGWTNGKTIGKNVEGKNDYPMCQFSFIDKSGKIITRQRFDDAKNFSEGLAAVQVGGKWGFINKSGQMVISPQFEEERPSWLTGMVGSFSDGLALVKINEHWGYIDKTGNFAIPPQFRTAGDFSDGLAPVGEWDEEKRDYTNYYFINKKGKQAFRGKFALASHFFKGLAHVKLIEAPQTKNNHYRYGKFAYIDTKGKVLFSYEINSDDVD